ncbi:MAG: ATP-binding protein [bacterium]
MMIVDEKNSIEVTVDKSHIVTIGERLYSESIELIRELINNAYDADASEVKVSIKDDYIIVEDNGLGMDLDGLKQYFNIGSTFKKNSPKSPKFSRDRIGEFGIGKFASLSACTCFEVWTKKNDFQAKVIFDKEEWNKSKHVWHLPLLVEEPDASRKDGTKVLLRGIKKVFNIADVEKRIIEAVPLKAPDFNVYLNGYKVKPRFVSGHKIPFLEGTQYGVIYGEIIIISQLDQDISCAGIECKVKQVTITRDFFGLDALIKNITRIQGEVHADFLPITSDRTGFIKDTPQYQVFMCAMERIIERIKPVLHNFADKKENKRVRKALSEVLDKIKTALALNPDYCPEGLLPVGDEQSPAGQPGHIVSPENNTETTGGEKPPKKLKKRNTKKPTVTKLTPTAVIKKLKSGQQGLNCCIDHFGPQAPESFTEGTIVYINRDHPLYQKWHHRKDTAILHIARLLTQEISLMKNPRNPRQAFERQSKLLKDALI